MSHSTHQPPYDGAQQPPYGAQPPQYGHPAPPRRMRNGLGTTALVLGILGVITGPIPLIFWLGGTFALLALIMGLVGRGRAKRGEASNKGVALAGVILGLLGMIGATIGAVITFKAVDDAVDEFNKSTSASREPAAGSGKGDEKDGGSKDGALAAGEAAVYKNGVKVSVSKPEVFTPSEYAVGHTKGNKAYIVNVTIENTGSKKFESTLVTAEGRAGADGVTAEQIFDDKVGAGFTGTVLPGKKSTVKYAFDAPADAKNLSVEVSPGLLLDASVWELSL